MIEEKVSLLTSLRSKNPRFLVFSYTGKTFLFPDPLLRSNPVSQTKLKPHEGVLNFAWVRDWRMLEPVMGGTQLSKPLIELFGII